MAYPISPESFVPVQPYGAYDGFPPYFPEPPATPIVPGNVHEALVAGKPTLHEALVNNPVQYQNGQGLPRTVTPGSAAQGEMLSPIRTTTNIVPQNISEALQAKPVQYQNGPGQVRPVTPYGQTQGLQIVRPGESISDGVYRETPKPGYGDIINKNTDTGKRWYTNIKAQEIQKGIDAAKNAPAAQQGIEAASNSLNLGNMAKKAVNYGGKTIAIGAPAAINMLSDKELLSDQSVPMEARLRVAGEDAVRGLASGIPFMLGGSPWTLPLKIGASALIDNTLPDNMFGANNIRAGYQADKQQRGLDAAQQKADAYDKGVNDIYQQGIANGDFQKFEDIATPGKNGAANLAIGPNQPTGLNAVPPEAQQSDKRAQQIGEDGGITQGDKTPPQSANYQYNRPQSGIASITGTDSANNKYGISSADVAGMDRVNQGFQNGLYKMYATGSPEYKAEAERANAASAQLMHNLGYYPGGMMDRGQYGSPTANRQLEIQQQQYNQTREDNAASRNYQNQLAQLQMAALNGDQQAIATLKALRQAENPDKYTVATNKGYNAETMSPTEDSFIINQSTGEAKPINLTPKVNTQAEAIRSQYKAGKITREEANKQLRALGQ